MGVEIRRGNLPPKVLGPSMKKNRSSLLAMVKHIMSVIVAVTRQNNALQPLGKATPIWQSVDESLHVSFADYVTKSAPW